METARDILPDSFGLGFMGLARPGVAAFGMVLPFVAFDRAEAWRDTLPDGCSVADTAVDLTEGSAEECKLEWALNGLVVVRCEMAGCFEDCAEVTDPTELLVRFSPVSLAMELDAA